MLKKLSPFHFDISASEPNVPEHIHRSMQYAVWESAFSGVIFVFTGGVVLTGLALALGANELIIGLIAALQAGGNLWQIRAFRVLERRGHRKAMAIKFGMLNRLAWIPICILVLIPFASFAPYRLWLFLLFFAISLGVGIFSSVPWISWLVDLVPQKLRGRFFAQRNFAGGTVNALLGIAAGKFIDLWKAHRLAPELYGFVILIAIGIVFGLFGVSIMRKMHDPAFTKPATPLTFWQSLKIPFRDANFRRLFYFRLSYDFSMGIAGAFYGVYMLTQAGLSFTFVSTLVMLSTLTNLLALKPWGKMIDKFGNKPTLYICMIGKTLFALLWIFTMPETFWLYILLHLFGVFDAGNAIAIPNFVYKLAPADRRANYIAVDGTVVGIAATIAPLIGGGLAHLFANVSFSVGSLRWSHFHFLFFTAALLRLITFWTLRRVREPESKPVGQVISVMLPLRSLDISEELEQALHALLAPARNVIEKLLDRPQRRAKPKTQRRIDKETS